MKQLVLVAKNNVHTFEQSCLKKKFDYKVTGVIKRYSLDTQGSCYEVKPSFSCGNVFEMIEYEISHPMEFGDYTISCINILNKKIGKILCYDNKDTPKEFMGVIRCDACKTGRVENRSIVLKNTKTGEFISVGGNCVRKYLPGSQSSFVASFADLSRFFFDSESDGFSFGGFQEYIMNTYDLMWLIYSEIKQNGFVSQSDSHVCTKKIVYAEAEKYCSKGDNPKPAPKEFKESIKSFIKESTDNQLHNAREIINTTDELTPLSLIGMLLFGVLKYHSFESAKCKTNSLMKELEAGEYKDMEFIIGSNIVINGQYGPTNKVTFQNSDYVLTWFTQKNIKQEVGETVRISFRNKWYESRFRSNTVTNVKFL